MATVTFDKATRLYRGSTSPAVDELDLDIADGEFLVLVGPSGCGKSTCLRMLAGLEDVNAGEILIGDRDVTEVPPQDRDIAMVFQNYALYPHMTVAENMAFALKIARARRRRAPRGCTKRAKLLDLEATSTASPRPALRRAASAVAMGRAIVRQPQCVPDGRAAVEPRRQAARETRAQIAAPARLGVTTVYVTHDQIEAMTMGDRVAVLRTASCSRSAPPGRSTTQPENALRRGLSARRR